MIAPAKGTVLDVLTPSTGAGPLGYLVRINHNGTYSFFAHLDGPSNIFVQAGTVVKQGQVIANTGSSGNTTGIHLHFEGRVGAVAGDRNSGNPSPVRSLPGNWFNTWYSPVPDLRWNDAQLSGGAQYPERKKRPTTTSPGARHLSANQSPPNGPAGWASNVNPSTVTLHFGAAPDTPNSNWATTFNVYEWRQAVGNWTAIPGGPDIIGPWYNVSIGSWNQSESNGQHTFQAYNENAQTGASTFQRYWEIWPGDTTSDRPRIIATYRPGTDSTTLDFCTSGDRYKVYEYHGGASQLAYSGPGCTILVHRDLVGNINQYSVSARIDGVWTPPSPWLVIHY